MKNAETLYGSLRGISSAEFYADGSLKECVLAEANVLKTPYGEMIPQYQNDGLRRKYVKSLSFYPEGILKSISLQKQVAVRTSIGVLPAELVTFHPSGEPKRLFPLNGKISGFWSEDDEYKLAQEFEFSFPFGRFKQKIIGIQFYDNGAAKSITFWPRDSVMIQSSVGPIEVHTGFSMYPEGNLKSLEPSKPTLVSTPIGDIEAYDMETIGIHGDTNSLKFTAEGQIQGLITSTGQITVSGEGQQFIYRPGLKPSLFDDEKMDTVPLKIEFEEDQVRFGGMESDWYDIKQYQFAIRRIPLSKNGCKGCSACISGE